MNEIPVDDAFLQVNDDQRGVGVKNSKRHRVFLLGYKVEMCKRREAVGSILSKPRKQFERRLKLLPLVSRKLLRDGRGEPVLSRGSALLNPLQAFGRERQQSFPPVARVRRPTDQARLLQRSNYSSHGLRAHAFRSRQT